MKHTFKMRGYFVVEHRNKAGKLIGIYCMPNGIVDVGMNMILDTMFHATGQSGTWYLSLIDNAGGPVLSDADTMAAHAGWTECVAYGAATRPEWTEGAAAAREITNAATIDFAINDTKTIYGIFVVDENTKGGATDNLWATAAFSSTVAVQNGDTLKITYTVSG